MNQRQSRTKRNSFIINLVETSSGFSIVEGVQLLNKIDGPSPSAFSLQYTLHNVQSQPLQTSREPKAVFKKVNLVFHRPQFEDTIRPQHLHKFQETPSFCKAFAEWFDLNEIHEIERSEVLQWYSQKVDSQKSENEQKQDLIEMIDMYKSHRDFMVNLYSRQYASDHKYLSANVLRNHISCDAFWLSRVHLFLTKHGIINTTFNLAFQGNTHVHTFKNTENNKQSLIPFELDTSIKDSSLIDDNNKLLKKLTSQIRPYCDYCRIHCGIVWFQHNRSLDPKEISNIMKNVNSKNPPLSQKEYEYILCVRCYCQNHFPLLLTNHDFKKICVNDKLEPSRKKRNKRRRREKRKREGEEQGAEDNEEKAEDERSNHQEEEEETQKNEEVKALIQHLATSFNDYKWTLAQISLLLDFVQKHGEDWQKIHELMKKHGYCRNIETQQVIFFFLSLPRRGISRLQEEYSDDELIQNNFSYHNHPTGGRVEEKKLSNSIQFSKAASKQQAELLKKKASFCNFQWKTNLERMVCLSLQKIDTRISYLSECENTVKDLRVFIDQL